MCGGINAWVSILIITASAFVSPPKGGASPRLHGQSLHEGAGNIIAAYGRGRECDDKMLEAAREGANVLIWFSITLSGIRNDSTGKMVPKVVGGPDHECVARIKATLESEVLPTVHLISIGGWGAPHPDTTWSGADWFAVFDTWNQHNGTRLFDGFDWDLEGTANLSSQVNHFSLACLTLVGEMSELGKLHGYDVTMVPAQSYLDPNTKEFSRNLTWPPVQPWHQDFLHQGRNAYAYLVAKYGHAFTFISIQLYETWSAANFALTQQGTPVPAYLAAWVRQLVQGWIVDFSMDPSLNMSEQVVAIQPDKLIVGLTNEAPIPPSGMLLIWPEQVEEAWAAMSRAGGPMPRGIMFWNAEKEGNVPNHTRPVYMAKSCNKFLHTRPERLEAVMSRLSS